MNARQHLAALLGTLSTNTNNHAQVEAIHAARNFLAVPELEPKAFQQRLCASLQQRANSQHLPSKGMKRTHAYIEGTAGAIMALESVDPELVGPTLALMVLLCARGGEVVDHIAEGKPV